MNENKKLKLNKNVLIPNINVFVIMILFIIWSYVILIKTNYFKHMPLPLTTTGLFENVSFNLNFDKLKILISSILVLFLNFISFFGYGSFVVNKFFNSLASDKKFVLSIVLGIGILALIIFFVGTLGLIYKTSFVILLVLGIFLFFLNREIFLSNLVFPKFNFFQTILFFIFLYSVFINLLGALTPETFFDSQFYLLG
ncbi:MAG: hypothetical protein ACK4WJ_05490, partial [Endomicrobiia bacterium]